MLKYYNFDIVFQEIPDEVTLAVNITNCPHHCPGCHSPHLHENVGFALDETEIDQLLSKYGKQITCFCFMGGDANPQEVSRLADYLHKNTNLKVAWYSGNTQLPDTFSRFDYVKVGPYLADRGGLNSRETNQRLYRNQNGQPFDLTHRFWKSIAN
ncbi:MAG: anaerobic ribonucleoside-triphosphate reductase activating protein [Bacteroidales bacterium]|jgi:anaerobic ribonucleoside-triphosphate reductase activating protein|nr:anaerobic ribonucleoside-triphosphate reductase activating protein [Bacteroidales bacterium]